MTTKKLEPEDVNYIRKLIWKHDPALLGQVENASLLTLPDEIKERIEGILTDELCDNGIGPDGEINDLGLKLEDLVQRVMGYV